MGSPSFHPTGGPKLTQQHMAGSTDIHSIVERHRRTGVLQSTGKQSGRKPSFIHITGDTFHEMLIKVQQHQGQFAALPAKIRRRFANNPENLFRFLEDSKNLREAVALGLVDEEDITPERKAQMDLVEASEAEERVLFEKWRAERRAAAGGGREASEEANPEPIRSDPEAQPSFSKKKRTS